MDNTTQTSTHKKKRNNKSGKSVAKPTPKQEPKSEIKEEVKQEPFVEQKVVIDYAIIKQTLIDALPKERSEEADNKLIEKSIELSKDLPERPMKLQYQHFRFGFRFYLGLLDEKPPAWENSIYNINWCPVAWSDGFVLEKLHTQGVKWPLQDRKGAWFIPQITKHEDLPPPSGSAPTDQYINDLIRYNDFNKLEALKPYEKQIKECSEHTCARWLVWDQGNVLWLTLDVSYK